MILPKPYLTLFSLGLVFCGESDHSRSEGFKYKDRGFEHSKEKLLLFLPASTFGLFEDLLKNHSDHCKHKSCLFSYASSAALARQILHGRVPDLYISADARWMEHLAAKGLLWKQSRKKLFANRLVLALKANSDFASKVSRNLKRDLKEDRTKTSLWLQRLFGQADCWSTADPDSVPLGRYAKQTLSNMALWHTNKSRLRTAPDARRALYLLERGECELGILYKSGLHSNTKLERLYHFPAQLHDPIDYEIALLFSKKNKDKSRPRAKARALYKFLGGPQSKAFYLKFGFLLGEL